MTEVHSPPRRWPWILLTGLFLLTAGMAFLATGQAQAQVGLISGTVTDPDGGLPPPDSRVFLLSPDGSTHGQAMVDPASGDFNLGPVAYGNYILQARPPAGTAFTPSLPEPVLVTGAPVNVGTLPLTYPSVTGTVFAPDGTTPVAARVHVYRQGQKVQSSPASGGQFQLGGLPDGVYALQAEPVGMVPFWLSARQHITITAPLTATVNLALTPANAVGVVVDPQGVPVPGATVHVLGAVHHVYRQDISDGDGYFTIGGLAPDTYLLRVDPPWNAGGLTSSELVLFSVPPEFHDLGQIRLRQAPKILTGQVTTNTGAGVVNARIIANRVGLPGHQEGMTGAGGNYQMRLSGGLWAVTVEPTDQSQPPHWVYHGPPKLVFFAHNLTPEFKTLDFEVLTADSLVTGHVALPDGSVPPFTTTVSLRNNEGIGRTVLMNPADGSFSLRVPHGNYLLHVNPHDPAYAGPPPLPVRAPEQGTVDVGTLTLLARDAAILGVVRDSTGAGVGNIRVIAWTRGHQGAQTRTNPDGSYALAVTAGDWLVRPVVPPNLPYVYTGDTISVTVASGATVSGVDFRLTDADNVLVGQLIDGTGQPVMVAGVAAAFNDQGRVNHAPIRAGNFEMYLPDGDFQVGLDLAPGSGYLAGSPQPVSVSGGGRMTETFTLLPQDATIAGALWDPRARIVPTGVPGFVMADNPFAWVGDHIDPANGTYRLPVSAGLWHLSYAVAPDSGYVALDHHQVVPLQSGQTALVPLPVARRDSVLAGQVLDPNGHPLPGAVVTADGLGRDVGQVTLRTHSGDDGRFRLPVPHGVYRLRAGHANPDWLNPVQQSVIAPPGGMVTTIVLQFREPDVTLSGTTSLAGRSRNDGRVHIWAYTEDGAATHTSAPLGEPYTLDLLDGLRWHIGAVWETSNSFYAVRTTIVMNGNQNLDLVLQGPFPKPGPVSVSFDASEAQSLVLADGTRIFIPAGAMPVAGQVTLHITPIATLPHQHHARLYKYGYAFIARDANGAPITANFNQNVIISFGYDEAELAQLGLVETHLRPAYFSTTTNSWTIPDSYVVDTADDRVTMQIDHFTDYTLLAAPLQQVFLPTLSR